MKKQTEQKKDKKDIFVIQIIEDCLKIMKFRQGPLNKKELVDFEFARLASGINDKELIQKAKSLLEKLNYNNNQTILSLPRHQATCRYIKVPAKSPAEIDKIIPFQASKYLPYPAQELITVYQIIATDKEGYSHINLNIVHRNIILSYLSFLDSLGIKFFSIILSSYGLCNLYSEIERQPGVNMVVDVDDSYAELIVVSQKKLSFSRSFKIPQQQSLEDVLSEEIKKTNSAYIKETGQMPAAGIIIFTSKTISAQDLSAKISMPVEISDYCSKSCPRQLCEKIKEARVSVAGLIGLGLKEISAELNILPENIKQLRIQALKKKEFIKSAVTILLSILMLTFAVMKDLDNKRNYKDKLKIELDKISKEAKTLDELERRFVLLESEAKYKLAVLEVLYELHKIMPKDIYLSSFVYEDDRQIALRGQTPELNYVLELVSVLEKSKAFGNFTSKLRYATKKKTQTGEIIDFELICLKKK
ncbi:MAG: PilN domain-containing protein [Candidatus Omnitrophota bacterium]|jgi:Tfp pilus assembly PilM family ATPase